MTTKKPSVKEKNIATDGEAFRLLFENHPVPMLIYDLKTLELLRVNDAAIEQYGYSRDELKNMGLKDILPADEIARLLDNLKHKRPSLQHSGEWRNLLKNGQSIIVEVTSHELKFEGRKSVLVMSQDITERRQADETLIKLKTAVDTSKEAIFLTDTDGIFTYVNPGFSALYGYSAEELIGKVTPRILKSGLLDAQVYVKFWKTLLSGREAKGELINKRKNGKLIDIDGSATPILDDAKRTIGYLGIQRDITPRKQTEEAIRIAEENYRSLFENATVGIYQSTPQGRFLNVNPVMARIFGYDSPEDMLTHIINIEEQYYTNPEDRRKFQQMMTEQGEVHELSNWNYRKDGTRILIQENAHAVKGKHGKILHYEGFVTDVTQRKQAEDGLHRAKESLEYANRELEIVLAREQQLARTDGLTGLYNYRHFFELASYEFDAAMRHKRPLAILMFDADGFKQINDSLGHIAGDKLLEMVAQTATAQMRTVDILARYGGDEFVVLLSQTTARQALFIAERIRTSVAAVSMQTDLGAYSITLSIGISEMIYEPKDDNMERIIQRADKALYNAKQSGRNRTVIFDV